MRLQAGPVRLASRPAPATAHDAWDAARAAATPREDPMGELSQDRRDRLPDSAFAYVDRSGERHLPINDEDHIRNAMSRWNQTDFESAAAKERARKRIVSAAKRHDLEVSDDDKVAHPVH
jgi:hypothetical protein